MGNDRADMCERLSDDARNDFFDLSRAAWTHELITSSELHKRLRVLDDMRGPAKSWTYNPVWIRRPSMQHNYEPEIESESTCFVSSNRKYSTQVENSDDSSNGNIHIVVQLTKNDWEFHKGDPDPHPSIPHGHKTHDERRKLDAYLGYTFVGTTQDGRIPKSEIIKLWNDNKFRRFADEALKHFITTNPIYKFRVSNPHRLPKKR